MVRDFLDKDGVIMGGIEFLEEAEDVGSGFREGGVFAKPVGI